MLRLLPTLFEKIFEPAEGLRLVLGAGWSSEHAHGAIAGIAATWLVEECRRPRPRFARGLTHRISRLQVLSETSPAQWCGQGGPEVEQESDSNEF